MMRSVAGGICPTCNQRLIHPFWEFLKFALVCGLLTLLLYSNATNFDQTELRTLFSFGVIVGVLKFGGPQGLKLLERWLK